MPIETAIAHGPLSGLLVADFSRVLAGPYCTMMLADLGADVIKVESPAGDDTRTWVPPQTPEGVSTYYLGINRNKRSIVLDLAEESDLQDAHELARRADVLVENFKPGGLHRFGLDYDSVAAANPTIIYASISGFGVGRGARIAGYDLSVQAIAGLMSMTGDPEGDAYRAGSAVFDVMSGMNTAIAILAALQHRTRTGAGQHVNVNLMSTALAAMSNHTNGFAGSGHVPFRMGNAHPSLFPYEPLPTADGDLIVIAGNNGQFAKLCEVLGVPELAADARFATNQLRTQNRDQLRPLLVERLMTRTRAQWFDALLDVQVPSAPINRIDEGLAFAESIGLDPVVEQYRDGERVTSIRNPVDMSGSPVHYRLPPPRLGEHTDDVRAWLRTPDPKDAS